MPLVQPAIRVMFTINSRRGMANETYWLSPSVTTLSQGMLWAENLAVLRANVLASDCAIREIRVSFEGVHADSLVLQTNPRLPGFPAWGPVNVTNDCLNVRMNSAGDHGSSVHFSGIPDSAVNNDKLSVSVLSNWYLSFLQYLKGLCGFGLFPKGLWGNPGLEINPATHPRVGVRSVSGVAGNNFATVTTWDQHYVLSGGVVRITNVPYASQQYPLNRLWQVGEATPNTLQILDYPLIQSNFLTGSGGKVIGMVRGFHPYRTFNLKEVGSYKRDSISFLASWQILEPWGRVLLDPGCYAMARLPRYAFYRTRARIFRDSNLTVTLRWFEVPPDTPFLPVAHHWAGKMYLYDRTPPTVGVGELTQSESFFVDRHLPHQSFPWTGSDDWWANGVPISALQGPAAQQRPGLCPPGPMTLRGELPLNWILNGIGGARGHGQT